MITEKENTRISKFLSLVLRHKPDTIDIALDEQGWTDVQQLLQQLNKHGFQVTFDILEHVVTTNSKSRFAFNADRTRVRASQGHSVEVELGYEAKEPPAILYHGTAEKNVGSILRTGLQKQARHHVHLSVSSDTALAVGQRYGKPVLLQIAAKSMYDNGYSFFVSENNVWLTDHVPVAYISTVE